MTKSRPSAAEIAAAVTQASHAPSVHNTQPWRWRVTTTALELFADRTRRLHSTDPHGRLLMLSCGATLNHLTVAMGASGWSANIIRFPDRSQPSHLASITFERAAVDTHVKDLAQAISSRRSDRRPMSSWPVPDPHVQRFTALAAEYGGIVQPLSPEQTMAWDALARLATQRKVLPEYRQELYAWTHRREASRDGIPAANRVSLDERVTPGANRFPPGDIPLRPRDESASHAVSLLISTSSDDAMARLRAGEALSAILLEATSLGLATAIDSQVLELDSSRAIIESDMLHGTRSPQVLVTVGWPSSADPLPETPRRELGEILGATTQEHQFLVDQLVPGHQHGLA